MKNLKIYLRINSIFSLASGILMAEFSNELLHFFNIQIEGNRYLFDIIGINLIVFAIFVWYVSARQIQNSIFVKIISFLDILWIVGSIIIVALQLFNLSIIGYLTIALVALWISFLAYNQLKHVNISMG